MFDARPVQNKETGPQHHEIEKADKTEEQWHVHLRLVAHLLLHHNRVDAVHDGAERCHGVAECNLRSRLVRE